MKDQELKTVAAVERALSIMDAFRAHGGGLNLTEISECTGLYKSTALRLLQTLIEHDYVTRTDMGVYNVGVAPLRLSALYQNSVQPSDVIMPILRELVQETGESASYNVEHDGLRICVYRVDSPHRVRDHLRPGDVLPLGKGAAGRILDRYKRQAKTGDLLDHLPLVEMTVADLDPDTAGVAAPVFGPDDTLSGVLAVSGPRSRFGQTEMDNIARVLTRLAKRLTVRMGGRATRFEATGR